MKLIRSRILLATLAVLLGTAIAKSQTADPATPPPPMHGDFGFGPMLHFYTKALDLTDAQQAQIKAILQKERPAIKPLMEQLHETELQLKPYEEGAYDEAKVRSLAAQESQTQVELTVQKTRIHNELFQLLTSDQQAKLKELEANRQARMQQRLQSENPPSAEE